MINNSNPQVDFQKRLKNLMKRPENQICSDCTDIRPSWVSLIVPPPNSPKETQPIGAFCCYQCSGSHRRLGVHISFVRSITLDTWKESEVLALENGGNQRVNSIFEGNNDKFDNKLKPDKLADLPTREQFIRDKYQHHKYVHPEAFFDAYGASCTDSTASTSEESKEQTDSPKGTRGLSSMLKIGASIGNSNSSHSKSSAVSSGSNSNNGKFFKNFTIGKKFVRLDSERGAFDTSAEFR